MAIPKSAVSFNKDHISELAKNRRAAEGYFAFLSVEAEAHDSESEKSKDLLMSKIRLRMLENPKDIDSVKGRTVQQWLTWPLANPDIKDHEPPDRGIGEVAGYLSSMFPDEVLDVPRLVGEGRVRKLFFKGEEITREEEQACKEEALDSIGPKSAECFTDHALLVGHVFFARLYYQRGSDFPSLAQISATQKEDLSTEYEERGADSGKKSGGRAPGRAKGKGRAAKKKGRGRR